MLVFASVCLAMVAPSLFYGFGHRIHDIALVRAMPFTSCSICAIVTGYPSQLYPPHLDQAGAIAGYDLRLFTMLHSPPIQHCLRILHADSATILSSWSRSPVSSFSICW